MKINYISGPAGCGKTLHLHEVEKQAYRNRHAVVRIDPGCSAMMINNALRFSRAGAVVLIDEGLNSYSPHGHKWEDLPYPADAQVFVARQGERNEWEGVK